MFFLGSPGFHHHFSRGSELCPWMYELGSGVFRSFGVEMVGHSQTLAPIFQPAIRSGEVQVLKINLRNRLATRTFWWGYIFLGYYRVILLYSPEVMKICAPRIVTPVTMDRSLNLNMEVFG